jgi:hypothetical protein
LDPNGAFNTLSKLVIGFIAIIFSPERNLKGTIP